MALLSQMTLLQILIDNMCIFRYLSEKLYTIIENKLDGTLGQTEFSKIVVYQVLIIFETCFSKTLSRKITFITSIGNTSEFIVPTIQDFESKKIFERINK